MNLKSTGRSFSLAAIRTAFRLAFLAVVPLASAQPYQVGQIVTNNFSLVNRFAWTNDNGEVFTPSNTAFRLSDFAGKIVMFEFFAVW